MTPNRPRWNRPPISNPGAPRLVPVRIVDLRRMHLLQIAIVIVQVVTLAIQISEVNHG